MTRRCRATKLRTTLQQPIGTPRPEKREQLDRLRDHLVASGLTELRQAWMHPIYRQAMAYRYEDISPYFLAVDEEVRQLEERAKVTLSGAKTSETWTFPEPRKCSRDGCNKDAFGVLYNGEEFCSAPCLDAWCGTHPVVRENMRRKASAPVHTIPESADWLAFVAQRRREMVRAAFAELGRIVGEQMGHPLLGDPNAKYWVPVVGMHGEPRGYEYRPPEKTPALAETAPAPVKRDRITGAKYTDADVAKWRAEMDAAEAEARVAYDKWLWAEKKREGW